jgi:hypothetical protein
MGHVNNERSRSHLYIPRFIRADAGLGTAFTAPRVILAEARLTGLAAATENLVRASATPSVTVMECDPEDSGAWVKLNAVEVTTDPLGSGKIENAADVQLRET